MMYKGGDFFRKFTMVSLKNAFLGLPHAEMTTSKRTSHKNVRSITPIPTA